ncbi:MAG TPA: lysophospholipid acyltransferase family protein [Verrucomicrobiae bacterium]|nr:lysophospholipid acyltransferase family protein [Verrucomicrobiae bacterium]
MSSGSRGLPPLWLRLGFLAAAHGARALGSRRYRLADLVGNAAFACQPQRRSVTAANFRRALGPLGRGRARRLAAASYRAYARTAIDFLYVQTLTRVEVAGLTRVIGLEHLQRSDAERRGGILVLVHHGSWDIAGAAAQAYGFAPRSVMDDGNQPALTALVIWSRARIGLQVTTPSRGPATLVRALVRGGWVALLADLPGATPAVDVTLFGQACRFSAAPGLLAARTGAPMHAVTCQRAPDGHYVIEIHPPLVVAHGTDPAAALQPMMPVFEAEIRRTPDQWFPFGRDRFPERGRDGPDQAG